MSVVLVVIVVLVEVKAASKEEKGVEREGKGKRISPCMRFGSDDDAS